MKEGWEYKSLGEVCKIYNGISMHIANILKEKDLKEISVVKQYLTTAANGKTIYEDT